MKIVPIFVPHLGCPNDCVFCNQRAISGEVTPMTPQETYEILQKAKETIGNDFEVAFFGGSFTAICESLQNELLDVAIKFTNNIRISTRPDYITDEILQRLKSKNVKTIELGVQSMNDKVLARAKRGHTKEDTIKACELIKKHGFTLGAQMMIGLPLDTEETLMQTVDEIIKIKPNLLRIYPIVVVEDTELANDYHSGKYEALSVEKATEYVAKVMDKIENEPIKVIRVGLNPSEDLSNGKAIAGAYHPAFGQLVSAKRYLNKMEELIEKHKLSNEVVAFGVNKSEISSAIGNKAENKTKLYEKYKIKLKICEVDIKRGEIILLS